MTSLTTIRRSPRKAAVKLVAMVYLVAFVGGGYYLWDYQHKFSSYCDQVVVEREGERDADRVQRLLEKQQAKEARRLEKRQQREARDAELRMAWTRVIESSAVTVQAKLAKLRATEPVSVQDLETSDEVSAEEAAHWAFQAIRQVHPPAVKNTAWPRNPIDRFVLARLEEKGLAPSAEASRWVHARRLWFGLVGLPPEPGDLSAYVEDPDATAYEALTEALLAHRGFGERWGRVWLDLARYADSNGYEEDELRLDAYPYRDFVIWAMNEDLPYDLFVRWQIAGDELAARIPLAAAATGFLTAGPYNTFMPQEIERYDELDDMVSTLGSSMLGLSVGCARCHDHKYDPIPTRDYYGLLAVLTETKRSHSYLTADGGREYRRWGDPVNSRRAEVQQMLIRRVKEDKIQALDDFTEAEKDLIRQPVDPDNEEQALLLSKCNRCLLVADYHISDDLEPLPKDRVRYEQLMAEIAEFEPRMIAKPPMGLTIAGSDVSTTPMLAGGDLNSATEQVGPGFLTALTRGRPIWKEATWKNWNASEYPRSALAHWITDAQNGAGALLARVIVNRLWQHHFGRGLVSTPSDFGTHGDAPSHPALLEWLAGELIDSGWSLKHIHRLIVTSATYRQDSTLTDQKQRIDPGNQLLSRYRPRRLTAEMVRDAMLVAGGNLNRAMYGPAVRLPVPREAVLHTQESLEDTWPSDIDDDRPVLWRRSIYVMMKRTMPMPMLQLFDAPCGTLTCADRKDSNVPTQALALWHSPFVRRQSERLARRVIDATPVSADEQATLTRWVEQIVLITLGRQPTLEEIALAVEFLNEQHSVAISDGAVEPWLASLSNYCQIMFLANEFMFVE